MKMSDLLHLCEWVGAWAATFLFMLAYFGLVYFIVDRVARYRGARGSDRGSEGIDEDK